MEKRWRFDIASPCALILVLCVKGIAMNQRNQDHIAAMKSAAGAGRIAFIQSCWHKDIVDQCRVAFVTEIGKLGIGEDGIDFFAVPGSFEIPLQAQLLAKSGRY